MDERRWHGRCRNARIERRDVRNSKSRTALAIPVAANYRSSSNFNIMLERPYLVLFE
jgi:hypothetical protein